MTKIKKCLHCGGEPILKADPIEGTSVNLHYVYCECGMRTFSMLQEEAAKKIWNQTDKGDFMKTVILEKGMYIPAQTEIKKVKIVETKPDEEGYKKGYRVGTEVVDALGNEHLGGEEIEVKLITPIPFLQTYKVKFCDYCKGLGCKKCNTQGFFGV